LSSEIRRTITIDGKETVELDYSGMQIRMLYHKIGIDYKDECYIYAKRDKKHQNRRRLIKLTALISINAKSRKSALAALGLKIKEEKLTLPKIEKPIVKLYEQFVEYHKPIKQFIASDIGIELMAVDSEILGNILKALTEQGILGLPIHDSIIVQKKHRATLKQLMTEEYYKIIGFRPVIHEEN